MDRTGEARAAFHAGERAVQARAGVSERMARVGARTIRQSMSEQHRQFFGMLPFVLIGSVSETGQPWASIVAGVPGFASATDAHTLRIRSRPSAGDALLDNLSVGAPVAVLGLQPHTRRRNRANGLVSELDERGFTVRVAQSFGNCPKYIQAREATYCSSRVEARFEKVPGLSSAAAQLIRAADTFFIATAHPGAPHGSAAHGMDISHRGGRPGFVGLDESGSLVVPDFVGNFFFNTLGNIELHPAAGLLFIDFGSGDLLSIAATVTVDWAGVELAAFSGAERLLRVTPSEIRLARAALPLQWGPVTMSPHLEGTGSW
ncbi:MAG: pyridoxamine 5'-phosphate oxidase family protein [Gammaproteobacteria bacterium]|nr:pyridoxamine 5'-phosphate oxidase family protein [Gammaproteobacteria bacterium]